MGAPSPSIDRSMYTPLPRTYQRAGLRRHLDGVPLERLDLQVHASWPGRGTVVCSRRRVLVAYLGYTLGIEIRRSESWLPACMGRSKQAAAVWAGQYSSINPTQSPHSSNRIGSIPFPNTHAAGCEASLVETSEAPPNPDMPNAQEPTPLAGQFISAPEFRAQALAPSNQRGWEGLGSCVWRPCIALWVDVDRTWYPPRPRHPIIVIHPDLTSDLSQPNRAPPFPPNHTAPGINSGGSSGTQPARLARSRVAAPCLAALQHAPRLHVHTPRPGPPTNSPPSRPGPASLAPRSSSSSRSRSSTRHGGPQEALPHHQPHPRHHLGQARPRRLHAPGDARRRRRLGGDGQVRRSSSSPSE